MARSDVRSGAGIAALIGFIILLLGAVFYAYPPWTVADGAPGQEGGSHFSGIPAALWWVGSLILATSIIYGILRNRYVTPRERDLTQAATRQNYAEEERRAGDAP